MVDLSRPFTVRSEVKAGGKRHAWEGDRFPSESDRPSGWSDREWSDAFGAWRLARLRADGRDQAHRPFGIPTGYGLARSFAMDGEAQAVVRMVEA